jgi:hypothetical protein
VGDTTPTSSAKVLTIERECSEITEREGSEIDGKCWGGAVSYRTTKFEKRQKEKFGLRVQDLKIFAGNGGWSTEREGSEALQKGAAKAPRAARKVAVRSQVSAGRTSECRATKARSQEDDDSAQNILRKPLNNVSSAS